MNKKKTILLPLSFAVVMALVCSFAVLPVEADGHGYAVTEKGLNPLGWVLAEYTLFESTMTDANGIYWYSTPTGDPNCYLGWNEGTPEQSVLYYYPSELKVQGHCYFWTWCDDATIYCQITAYGTGSAIFDGWIS